MSLLPDNDNLQRLLHRQLQSGGRAAVPREPSMGFRVGVGPGGFPMVAPMGETPRWSEMNAPIRSRYAHAAPRADSGFSFTPLVHRQPRTIRQAYAGPEAPGVEAALDKIGEQLEALSDYRVPKKFDENGKPIPAKSPAAERFHSENPDAIPNDPRLLAIQKQERHAAYLESQQARFGAFHEQALARDAHATAAIAARARPVAHAPSGNEDGSTCWRQEVTFGPDGQRIHGPQQQVDCSTRTPVTPQPHRPEAVAQPAPAPVARQQPTDPQGASAKSIDVPKGSSLSKIAGENVPAGVDRIGYMAAIQAANREDFMNGPHQLAAGAKLSLPSAEEAKAFLESPAGQAARVQMLADLATPGRKVAAASDPDPKTPSASQAQVRETDHQIAAKAAPPDIGKKLAERRESQEPSPEQIATHRMGTLGA